jgi:hypothetical protein
MKIELPPALVLLKDWSIWLVSLQTGALGLVSFIVGKSDNFSLNMSWLKLSIIWFAVSICSATFVLAALPDIALRMGSAVTTNFYDMGLFFPFRHVPLWVFTAIQHYFFLFGLASVVMAIGTGKKGASGR